MAYHRGGHAGAVAVSYSTNAMPTPLSPSRRYSSGSTGSSTSGVVTSSSTKLASYRSSGSTSFDRSSYYSSGSNSTSGYGVCSSTTRRPSYSDYRRFPSPARSLSVSSSSYSEAGSGRVSPSLSSSRYSSTLSSTPTRNRSSESRETLGSLATSAADIIAKYSPANYIPNIAASNERNNSISNGYNSTTTPNNTSSSLSSSSFSLPSSSAIYGGNAGKNLTNNELNPASAIQGRPPRATRRSPVNTLINHAAIQQPECAQPGSEVTNNAVAAVAVAAAAAAAAADSKNNNGKSFIESRTDEIINSSSVVSGIDNVIAIKINNHVVGGENGKILNLHLHRHLSPIPSSLALAPAPGPGPSSSSSSSSFSSPFSATTSTTSTTTTTITTTTTTTPINSATDAATDFDYCNDRNLYLNDDRFGGDCVTDNSIYFSTLQSSSSSCPNTNRSNLTLNNTADSILITNCNNINNNNNQRDVEEDANQSSKFGVNSVRENEDQTASPSVKSTSPSPSPSSTSSSSSSSSSVSLDLANNSVLARRPGGNYTGDDNASTSLPSTSRRGDTYTGNGTTSDGINGLGNTLQSATAHQNSYRGITDQIEGSPTIRASRNRLQTPRDERCGLNGLRNIGNTCFMNSVIQCLSNTRPLLEYLINEQYQADINMTTSSMKGALIKAFSQVIQELWEVGGDHVVNTASLKSQIQRFAPRFMGYSQQDAQEFLRYLLEGLHEDVNRVTVKPQPIHTDIPEHYTDSQKAAESWKRYLRNEDSTIVDVFVGQLRSSLHCTSCGHVSVTLDPFWDLSLPIPTRSGTVKLNQCLEHFTREEVLDGDEKPTCSKCQMRRKCTKSFSIQKFPKILVIHLKRFSPMERFRGKLNTLVDFPLTGLDLGAFSAPRVAGCTYNLYGVANHSGTTYSGHYTAYCKHPYSGEWHEYNDTRVSSIAARSVVSSEGYVLFYEQQPHSSNL